MLGGKIFQDFYNPQGSIQKQKHPLESDDPVLMTSDDFSYSEKNFRYMQRFL
jgi:hypothetical protein